MLAPADRNRLASVLGLLGSPHAGERDAAALAADRFVRGRGLTWRDVLGGAAAAEKPAPAQATAAGWRADLALCQAHLSSLSQWEQDFALSLSAKRNSLSTGQRAKLAEIAAELRSRGFA